MDPQQSNIMRKHRIRFWLAVGIFIAALILLVAAAFPLGVVEQQIKVPPVLLPTATPISLILNWTG